MTWIFKNQQIVRNGQWDFDDQCGIIAVRKGARQVEEAVLVVDDEREITDLLEVYLKNDGFRVRKAYCGADALKIVAEDPPALAILDVMLPDMDGYAVCRKIREDRFFPIIMLTAKVDDSDKIMGLTLGADDYITKPFNPLEVLARVKTQLRRCRQYNRSGEAEETSGYQIRGLEISKVSHKCFLYGRELSFTPTEFEVIWYLCQNQGKVVSSEELFEAVWGEKFYDSNNTVMAHISRIREKMREPARKPRYIKTVWGVGYVIE